jgi:hypothetical protein
MVVGLSLWISPASVTFLMGIVSTYWIIPAGLAVLYFYGTLHFNTPDYDVISSGGRPVGNARHLQMLTLVPPRFTTTRLKYRRYALLYALILQSAFLFIVLAWSVAALAGKDVGYQFPNAQDLQTRAVWALFALTGLLSAFPGFKDLDNWILNHLHRAALIPGGARIFAERLLLSEFQPRPSVAQAVRQLLKMRDTIRVAEHRANGSLETSILKMLWLKKGLEDALVGQESLPFQVRMEREFDDIRSSSDEFVVEARRYLTDQSKLVDEHVCDIDDFFDSSEICPYPDLSERRKALYTSCENLRLRLCVLAALFVNVTGSSPEDASRILQEVGFRVEIQVVPHVNWDALVKVAAGVFIALLVFNTSVIALYKLFGLIPDHPDHHGPGKSMPLVFSLIIAAVYGLIIAITRGLKKYWTRKSYVGRVQAQNIITCIASYGIAVAIVFSLASAFFEGDKVSHLLLGVSQLQIAVLGWFAGRHVDLELRGDGFSARIIGIQALCQSVAALIGIYYIAPDPPNSSFTLVQSAAFYAFIAGQAGLGGAIFSYMTQRIYMRPPVLPAQTPVTDSRVGELAIVSLSVPAE